MKIDYKKILFWCLTGLAVPALYGQSHFKDSTLNLGQQYVADQVVAVVGSSMILFSDLDIAQKYIEKSYKERGYTGKSSIAEAIEALLVQKVLASQAAVDSLPVDQYAIERDAEQRLQSMIREMGGRQQLEKFTNTPTYKIKDNIMRQSEEQQLANSMQSKIQSGVSITPAEVNRFYKKLDKDSLPIVPEQYIYAQIAKVPPKEDDVARMNVKGELLALRDRIVKQGANFAALARMYSEDKLTAERGGEMDPTPSEGLTPTFAEVLVALKPGQVSEVVETPYGFHLIQLLDKQGELYHFRHILMKVKFTAEQKVKAMQQLDSVLTQIRKDSLTFENAVELYSTDDNSRRNGGVVLNAPYERFGGGPRMKSNRFGKEDLGTDYIYIRMLKEGDMSEVYQTQDMTNGDEIIKFIKLIQILPTHTANLKDDYVTLEEMALAGKKNDVFEEWIDQKIAEMYIRIEEPYRSLMEEYSDKWVK